MPHVIVKMIEGKTEEQKQAMTAAVAEALKTTLGCSDSAISVAIEDFPKEDWTDAVYVPDIQGKVDQIYRKPGYDPFTE